jgi:hypothetical protein
LRNLAITLIHAEKGERKAQPWITPVLASLTRDFSVDALLGSMRSIQFDVQGFNRTYWDLFVAAGFSVGVF